MNLLAAIFRPGWRTLRPWRRHSLVVSGLGLAYVVVGITWALIPNPDRTAALAFPSKALELAHITPMPVLGAAWIGVGMAAILSARWPPWSETWGYLVLATWPGCIAAAYLASVLFLDAPLKGLAAVPLFGAFSFVLWAITGLQNPHEVAHTLAGMLAGELEED